MPLPAKYVLLTVIFVSQCAHIHSFKLSKRTELENIWENLLNDKAALKHTTPVTEEEAWEFLGIPRCLTGRGRQCFPGSASAQCFNGLEDACNGIVDCNCEAEDLAEGRCGSPDDESPEACQLKQQVIWMMENGTPDFGYGKENAEIFTVFWLMGLSDFCPAKETSKSRLTCPENPRKCVSVDQFCDGTEHCASLCYNIQGFKFCGTNDWLGGCLIKEVVSTVEQGLSRKRRDLTEVGKAFI